MKCEYCKKELSEPEEDFTEIVFAKGSSNEHIVYVCSVECEFMEIIDCIGIEEVFDFIKKYVAKLEHKVAELTRLRVSKK